MASSTQESTKESKKSPPGEDRQEDEPAQSCCVWALKHVDHSIMLVLCFWINVQSASSISCLGVLLVEFMEYYRVSKAAVTWVAGAHMGVSVVVGPTVGFLLKRFGSRTVGIAIALLSSSGLVLAAFVNNLGSLYVTFGLMAGTGPCTYYAIANSTIQHYFQKHRALACAVVLTAFSIGGFAWPPLCRWLIVLYNWQGALLIIGALHIQLLVPFMLMGVLESSKRHQQRLQQGEAESSAEVSQNEENKNPIENGVNGSPVYNGIVTANGEIYHSKPKEQKKSFSRCLLSWMCLTIMYSAGVCLGMILHAGVLIYTPVRSWQLGLTKNQGAILVSIISAAGGFCRIPSGLLGDIRRVNRGFLLASAIIVCGVLSFLSQFLSSFTMLAVFSAVYGCIIAIYLALQTVVLSDIAGLQHIQIAMGILLAGHGTSNLLLHPIAGALMDLTGSANTVFITVGLVGIGGGALVIIATCLKIYTKGQKKARRQRQSTIQMEESVPLQEGIHSSSDVKDPQNS